MTKTSVYQKVLKALDKDVKKGLAFSGAEVIWDIKSIKGMVKQFGKEIAITKLAEDKFQRSYVQELVNQIIK